jgi:hypothetical protein
MWIVVHNQRPWRIVPSNYGCNKISLCSSAMLFLYQFLYVWTYWLTWLIESGRSGCQLLPASLRMLALVNAFHKSSQTSFLKNGSHASINSPLPKSQPPGSNVNDLSWKLKPVELSHAHIWLQLSEYPSEKLSSETTQLAEPQEMIVNAASILTQPKYRREFVAPQIRKSSQP